MLTYEEYSPITIPWCLQCASQAVITYWRNESSYYTNFGKRWVFWKYINNINKYIKCSTRLGNAITDKIAKAWDNMLGFQKIHEFMITENLPEGLGHVWWQELRKHSLGWPSVHVTSAGRIPTGNRAKTWTDNPMGRPKDFTKGWQSLGPTRP